MDVPSRVQETDRVHDSCSDDICRGTNGCESSTIREGLESSRIQHTGAASSSCETSNNMQAEVILKLIIYQR